MKLKDKKIKKLFLSFFAALMLTSFSFFIYTLLTGKISFSELEDGWDGTTVATSFSAGNGTKENPYVIKTPEEFVYFKTLIEGENYLSYQDICRTSNKHPRQITLNSHNSSEKKQVLCIYHIELFH